MRVALHFEGVVYVDIPCAEDSDEWVEHLGQAWADVPDVDISNAADLVMEDCEPRGEDWDGLPQEPAKATT